MVPSGSNILRGLVILEPLKSNMVRSNPKKGFIFVYNNYPFGYFEKFMVPVFQKFGVKKYVCQEECGENGTPHLQGWAYFPKKLRYEQFELAKEIHWEVQKGSEKSNVIYCSKDSTCVGQRWSFGVKVPRPIRKVRYGELRKWQSRIADWFSCPCDFHDREINWFWEKKGNIGKSFLAKYFVDNTNCIVLSGKATDIFNGLRSYIETNGEGPDIILIDCPRSMSEFISYQAIEKLKDGLLYSGKYEGGMLRFNTPHVIAFSNSEPNMDMMSEDRWNIIEVNKFIKWVDEMC